uniref:Uncharacterized protein n=1 Tax=Oryza glaberrima TaxID=4538 RepID=I1R3W9_ORYGL
METSPSASTPTSCATLNACLSAPHRPFAMANPRWELLKKDNTYVYMHRLDGLQEAAHPLAQSPTGKVASPIGSSGPDSSAVAGAATTASSGDAAVAGNEDGGRRHSRSS